MKGVSIAIETIIYIIIAVMVMTVLIFFFTSQANPVQDQFRLRQAQTTLCGQYQTIDPTCQGDGTAPKQPTTPGSTLLTDLVKTCTSLGTDCTTGQLACIQRCCVTCPVRPA